LLKLNADGVRNKSVLIPDRIVDRAAGRRDRSSDAEARSGSARILRRSVVSSLASFDPARGSLRSWIFGIARYVWLESMRDEHARGGAWVSRQSDSELGDVPDPVTSASRRLARSEVLEKFRTSLQRFDAVEQRIIVLCGLEERTCGEVARLVDSSAEAVTKRWQRLRVKIQEAGLGRDVLGEL
jgi:RNA polymerase sigma factor (sigma-70 family)